LRNGARLHRLPTLRECPSTGLINFLAWITPFEIADRKAS